MDWILASLINTRLGLIDKHGEMGDFFIFTVFYVFIVDNSTDFDLLAPVFRRFG